jgi:hypothetical protein
LSDEENVTAMAGGDADGSDIEFRAKPSELKDKANKAKALKDLADARKKKMNGWIYYKRLGYLFILQPPLFVNRRRPISMSCLATVRQVTATVNVQRLIPIIVIRPIGKQTIF